MSDEIKITNSTTAFEFCPKNHLRKFSIAWLCKIFEAIFKTKFKSSIGTIYLNFITN